MNENVSGVKKIDVFNDVVSRLEDSKKAKVSDDVVSGMKNYYNNRHEYRNRVELLAENLKGIKPIDKEVNNVIYLSNYMEKGIAIKTPIISFKQIWVEYRLIYNENNFKVENNKQTSFSAFDAPEIEMPVFNAELPNNNNNNNMDLSTFSFKPEEPKVVNMDNFNTNQSFNTYPEYKENEYNFDVPSFSTSNYSFDSLSSSIDSINASLDEKYKKLYNKVMDINKYVESFNKKKIDLDRQISSLEERRNNLSSELRELENAKKEFSRYKEMEENKLKEMKNEVNNKVVSLQNLIDNLDGILGKIN